MTVITMTQTSGAYINGSTYRLRAREARDLVALNKATANVKNKFSANPDIRKGHE